MTKWCRYPVRNRYRIFHTDSIFGTDLVPTFSVFGTGLVQYRWYLPFLPSNSGPYQCQTVPYRVFSVPIPIFWDFWYHIRNQPVNKNNCMEIQLKEMQEVYLAISLKLAKVDDERQQLIMTL
ncbi:hypothetical protein Hdeb2414_s0005g00177441 [Helianthus debilis subsp. tardiflorus]